MAAPFSWLGITLLFAAGGCRSTAKPIGDPGATGSGGTGSGTSSGTASTTHIGGDSSTSGVRRVPNTRGVGSILAPGSEAIEIHRSSYWEGGYRFKRRIDQLSPKQLVLAEAIKVVPSTGQCWTDASEVSLTVTAKDTTRTYLANEYRGTCGRDGTLVDFEVVNALLDTVHCLPAKRHTAAAAAETAPRIVPDDGCWHGLFNGHGTTPEWWFRIQLQAAGEYRVLLNACGDRTLQLDLFEDDATTKVASASAEAKCPLLTHAFAHAGSYALRVKMRSGKHAGDFFLAVESASAQ